MDKRGKFGAERVGFSPSEVVRRQSGDVIPKGGFCMLFGIMAFGISTRF